MPEMTTTMRRPLWMTVLTRRRPLRTAVRFTVKPTGVVTPKGAFSYGRAFGVSEAGGDGGPAQHGDWLKKASAVLKFKPSGCGDPPVCLACWSVTQSRSCVTSTRWSGRETHPTATLCISRAARAQKHKKRGGLLSVYSALLSALSALSPHISTHQHTSAHLNTPQHTPMHTTYTHTSVTKFSVTIVSQ